MNVTKDSVKVCKDCEFRMVCSDCRAYLEIPDDILSKTLKCGYNPYNNQWSDWKKSDKSVNSIKYYSLYDCAI